MESVMQFDSDDDTLAILEDYQDESGGEPESRSSSISGRSTTIASIELKTKYLRMEACKRVRSEGANSYSGRLFGSRHINDLVPKQSFEKSLFGFCIDELQLRRLRGRRQGLSYQAAAAQLEHRLSGLVRSENLPVGPQKRLRRMLHRAIDEGRWGPELLVRSFDDWDRSLFGKRLSGHVWLVWHPDDPRVLGSLGHVEPAESSHQAMIWLNCDQIFKGDPRHTSWSQTREDMFRRMLGAFLLSCCVCCASHLAKPPLTYHTARLPPNLR
jgi:hypothetical protein